MPNKKKLYEALKAEGYDNFADESSFNAYVDNADNRKKLFSALKQEGYDNFADETEFEKYLRYNSEDNAEFEANAERFRNGKPIERVTTQSVIDANPELGLQANAVQPENPKWNVPQYDWRTDQQKKIDELKNSTTATPVQDQYGNEYYPVKPREVAYDEAVKGLKDISERKAETKSRLQTISNDVSNELKRLQGQVEVSDLDKFRPANLQSMPVNPVNQELMPEYTALRKAQRLVEESNNIIEEASKKGNTNFMAGFARGFWDNLNAEDYTFGADDAAQSAFLYRALDKAEKGESLTKAEETLLDAAAINMAVQAYYAQDLGRGYGAGSTYAESIPFMMEMAINPISASGKTTAKALLNYGLKKFAKNKAAKVGARLAGDALAATGMAARTGFGDVLEGTTDRLAQNYNYQLDDEGRLHVEKKDDTMGMGEAFARSFATRAIENQSEMIFKAFEPIGGFMKGVQDVLPGGVNKFFEMLGNNKVADAYRVIKNSPVFRNYLVKDIRNATQIGGLGEEYLEEVYNNIANAAIGEMKWEDVVSLDKNIDTLLGLAPTQVMFGLLGLGGAGAMRYQTRKTLEDLQATMNEQQRKDLEGLLDMGLDAKEVDVRGFIRNVMQNDSYTIENKRDLIKAAYNVAKQNGIDELTEADTIDKVNAENSLIDSVTDPSTGIYTEITATLPDAKEGTIEVPGYVVGWLGEGEKRQPIFVQEGMENTYENRRVLKPGQWNEEAVQQMPAEEVKAINEEMIREEAAQQAEQEAKYAPEVLNAQMPEGEFTMGGQLFVPSQVTSDGVVYDIFDLNEKGKPTTTIPIETRPVAIDEYRDMLQAQLNAEEAAQEQIAAEEQEAAQEVIEEAQPTEEVRPSVEGVANQPQAAQPKQPTLEEVVATLPKTNKGEIDYKAMTPQQQYQYTSITESPEVALEDLQADITAGQEEIVKKQEKLTKAKGGERAALRDEVRKLTEAQAELQSFYDSVLPKQEVSSQPTENVVSEPVAQEEVVQPQAEVEQPSIDEAQPEVETEQIEEVPEKTEVTSEATESEAEVNEEPIQAEALEMKEGESALQFAERAAQENDRRTPLRKRAEEWSKALGVDVTIYESADDIEDEAVRQQVKNLHNRKKLAPGWVTNGKVYFLMSDMVDMSEIDNTYVHEVVAHVGIEKLLGKERFAELCDKVWGMMPQAAKDYFYNYPGVDAINDSSEEGKIARQRKAADEYIAHLAEKENLTPEEQTIWDNIVKMFREMLDRTLNKILSKSKLTNADISRIIKASYANLKSGAEGGAVNAESNRMRAVERIEENVGEVDAEKGDVRFAVRDVLKGEERAQAIKDLMAVTGRSKRTVEKWLKAEESLASVILNEDNVGILDMEADESVPSIWKNSDYPQGTVEFSNICKKRLPFTTIYQRLQKEFPDTLFDAQTLNTIRNTMKEMGEDVACALCFVEDRRQLLGEIGQGFIDAVKGMDVELNDNQKVALDKLRDSGDKYVPNLFDIITLDGMKELRKKHPAVAQAFIEYNNARGMQSGRLFQAYSAYNREILKYNKKKVDSINNNGGLRIFSFSDFEAHHLIDLVQVLTDCAAKGIKVQGYTKVPEFAKAVKDTNAKINRSLIPKGVGYVDADYTPKDGEAVSPNVINGKRLLFDTIEGIDVNNPNFFDSTNSKSVGNILVAINDEHARLAMADPFVDYIIGFHTGQSKAILKGKGIDSWVNYKNEQLDKEIVTDEKGNQKMKNAPHHGLNIYTDVLNVAEAEGNPIKTAKQFTERFIDECNKRGWIPRFHRFLNRAKDGRFLYTPGYHKFLIDFKLFDKNGRILPQEAVVPVFDNEFNKQILDDYVKGVKEEMPNEAVYEAVKEAVGLGDGTRFSVKENATNSERGGVDSYNPSSEGLLTDSSERLSSNAYGNQKDVAKIENNTERTKAAIKKILNYGGLKGILNTPAQAVSALGKGLKMEKSNSSLSYYGDYFEGDFLTNGDVIHVRISTHPANGMRMGNSAADNKVSIVIRKDGEHFSTGEHKGYTEYIYEPSEVSLEDAANAIVKGIDNLISNGEFIDETGKAIKNSYPYVDEKGVTRFRVTPEYKQHQMDIINETNPASDDIHTWIRSVDDIKSFEEALDDSDYADYKGNDFDPSYTWNMVEDALGTGKVTVYSSYPIKNGVFVTPSYMEAQSYGGTTPYMAKVNLEDVAWIDPTQGQLSTDNKVSSRKAPSGIRFRTKEEIDSRINAAKKEFGITTNWKETGWLLTDGSQLDFSEKKNGGEVGSRSLDHRAVSRVFDVSYGMYSQWEYLREFEADGHIRISFDRSGDFGLIEMSSKPTAQQRKKLAQAIRFVNGNCNVDFMDNEYRNAAWVEYDHGTSSRRILADIDKYYDEGIKPVGNVSFRIANKNQEIFVSNAQRAVEGVKQEKATPQQWLAMIEKNSGLKAGEDKWLGLSDWLKGLDKKSITKAEILEFIGENKIVIEEVKYGEDGYFINDTRLDYTTKGLENKAEIALTIPTIEPWNVDDEIHFGDAGEGRAIAWIRFGETTIESKNLTEKSKILGSKEWWNMTDEERKSVMDELKELKQNSRSTRVLVIDEIQSKRHQEGRDKGYVDSKGLEEAIKQNKKAVQELREQIGSRWLNQSEWTTEESSRFDSLSDEYDALLAKKRGIPEAPFEKNWSELAFKRMLRYAAENGFDKVAWTTGEQQAERYGLGGVLNSIYAGRWTTDEEVGDGRRYNEESKSLTFYTEDDEFSSDINRDGKILSSDMEEFTGRQLADVIGKDLALKIINEEGTGEYSGDQLRIGGEGMKGFYDKMLPSFVNKYVKKWGAKVKDIELPNVEESGRIMHSVDVTDAMKESVMEGQAMFRISDYGKKVKAEVDKVSAKYNSKDVMFFDNEMTDEEVSAVVPGYTAADIKPYFDEGILGGYSSGMDKISIFANNNPVSDIEDTLFHENLHSLLKGRQSIVETFAENALGRFPKNVKKLQDSNYEEKDIPEELLVRLTAKAMVYGIFDDVAYNLPEGEFENLKELLKEFGYEYEQEIKSRALAEGRRGTPTLLEGEEIHETRRNGQDASGRQGEVGKGRKRKEQIGKLFDQVADMGLQGVLGNKEYTSLMVDIYKAFPEEVRAEIAEDALRLYGGSVAPAVSDYIGPKSKNSIMDKVVTIVREALRKIGFDLDLNANEVRYMAWRSKKPLDRNNMFEVAEDIDMKYRLKVGEYDGTTPDGGGTRFRVANKLQVRDEYEATIKKSGYQAREAVQDAMLSLRKFQELIEKASGKKIRDFENAWMHENRLSSVVQAEIHDMERKFYKPMMDAVKKLMKVANLEQEQVADYLMLKHGIERNREMTVRKALTDDKGKIDRTRLEQWYQEKDAIRNDDTLDTWRKKQEAMDNAALNYGADMSRDYSGLTSMFGTDDLADSTQKAYDEVEALETAHPVETESLGNAVKAMTQNTLDKSFESGLMDRKVYDELSKDMYDYYIPLRGFEETTSEEVYAYLDQDRGAFNAPLKRAKGRSSKSDNPIAYLKSIAESGIMQGNRNKMKQSFLNMVINNPSDLVSVREGVWVIYNPAIGEWEAASAPAIPNNATPADVEAAMEAWEQQMEQAAQNDPNIKKVSEAADVPYRVVGNRMDQHQIIVKRLGKSYTLTINGNPRLAMAINGQTNPNNTSNDGKVAAFVNNKIGSINRSLAAWYTTRNPDFVASNFMRDTFYTNTIVRAKEGNAYANKFHKNYAKVLPQMLGLFRKYENGTLNPADQTEAAFLDFMMNGGETGYSNLKDVEEIKKQIAKELKGNRFAKVEALAEKLDILNRAVENTARFAAFLTSREEGRSIAKSVFDAKEISVNFNKKGAGGTFFGMTGQTWFGNLAAMIGASGRALYVFFNAAIQGSTNLMHVMKVNPKGTSAGLAAMFLMGAVVPFLFGADDDEKDYYDLPEHVRRNHLIIPGAGDAWISIPLPIEYRIMYGMGELLTSWRTGHERGSDIARKMLSMSGQALPLNFLEEGLEAFVPSAVSPIYQVMTNSSWTGLPIYKENDFNKYDPEYTKAYSNVDRNLLKFTKALYEWSFDEENQKERIDLNPAIIETLAKGYFGGLATQLSNLAKVGGMIAGEQEFDWRNIPIGNRILKTGDERTKEKRVTNEYFENMEKLDFLQSRERMLKKTEKGVAVPEADKFNAQKDLETMQGTEVYKKYQEFKKQKKEVDKIRKTIKEKGSTPEREKQLMEAQEKANKSVR